MSSTLGPISTESVVPARISGRKLIPAGLIDLSLAITLTSLGIRWAGVPPVPSPHLSASLAFSMILIALPPWIFFRSTLGITLWRKGLKWGALGNLAGALICATTLQLALPSHPLWIRSDEWRMPPWAPSEAEHQSGQWHPRAFFYSMAAWPSQFADENAVLYSLPHEKGPPAQFIGRILAQWDLPHSALTIEGPKTPSLESGRPLDPALLSLCLQKLAAEPQAGRITCLKLREVALNRHISDIKTISPDSWELRWFEIDNEALPGPERARGFFISGRNSRRVREHYVLITPKGVHQTLILDRSRDERGELASRTLEQVIRSMRVSADLEAPKAWVNRELSDTRIDDLRKTTDPQAFIRLYSRIESLLLSKTSVEPSSLDAFYHLGGTSFLLLERATQSRRQDWESIARNNLKSSVNYAEDIAGSAMTPDPRLTQLRALWTSAQKR